jgi:Vacuolar protein 14 C-terminal Fig4p binding
MAHHATSKGASKGKVSVITISHRLIPEQVLAMHDGTFPALLKTLSDPAEQVVTRDLQLLSQISQNSEDDYFYSFMINLLQLFCTDRRLLETRGNLIIRQLCLNLSPERIYRTLADCLEKEEVRRYKLANKLSLTRSIGCRIRQYHDTEPE